MNAHPKLLILSAALAATLFTATPLLAQTSDAEAVAAATVPASRLATRYAELAGSEAAATDLVNDLRAGDDFTFTEQVTTTTTNPDGTTTTSTTTVERTVVNPNGPMGYGEVNITLSLAQALVDAGTASNLQTALAGSTTTTTNPDGTITTTTTAGVLDMRADGMGWGQIAKELGFNLGKLISAGNTAGKVPATKAERSAKADKAERAAKPDRVAKVDRPTRPEKLDRPERPERPQKPERGGRP